MKRFIMPALSALSFCCAAHAANLDVGGIRVGASVAQARAAASAMDSALVFNDLKDYDGKVLGFQGRKNVGSGPGTYSPDFVTVLSDDQGVAWFVGRAQMYDKGARPTTAVTLAALTEKFGEPSFKMDGTLLWQFDRSGKLYKGPANKTPCRQSDSMDTMSSNMLSPQMFVPKSFSEQCGSEIRATYRAENALVNNLVVTIYDSARVYDAIKGRKDAAAAANSKAQDAERSKNIKPKI